ncbi:MAG: hypothetical protein DIZ80_03595 [endosymbiont of Galathealinum brachiosum]|uniref:OmpH family outer membrane protein n=1 Tax=endosymbiont of Galathealinum brachiosum TaxID=2200906 RepID=A0A370DJL1_9GAMM|nr:MAG: hypothetical protein DIZ80_03595 [endosymbiont of Galathealinum brachiosum]
MFKKLTSSLLLLLFLTGCEQFQAASNTVVLDLDVIAKATGQAETIKQQVEKANSELTAQLQNISTQLNEQLAEEKKKLGKKPTAEDNRNIQQLTIQANQKMQQAKTLASQKSQQYRAALILQLRKNIQPVAEKIARERGADIVSISSNSMIWFNPEIDITDEVIAAVRAQPLSSDENNKATESTKNTVSQDNDK